LLAGSSTEASLLAGSSTEASLLAGSSTEHSLLAGSSTEASLLAGSCAHGQSSHIKVAGEKARTDWKSCARMHAPTDYFPMWHLQR
jgi:hypothetical protein